MPPSKRFPAIGLIVETTVVIGYVNWWLPGYLEEFL